MLGDQRLDVESDSAIVTKRKDGSLAIALWNYAEPGASGLAKRVKVDLRNRKAQPGLLHRVDAAHHSTLEEWTRMGRPESPNPDQTSKLQVVSAALKPESIDLKTGHAEIRISASGFVPLEIEGR